MENQRSREFLTIYNEIDDYMRHLYGGEDDRIPHTELIRRLSEKNNLFYSYGQDLRSFADLRNAIVHNRYSKDADPIAEPHEIIVKRYRDIKDQLIHPPKVFSVTVNRSKIYSALLKDKAIDVMNIMHKKVYTHVPVLENGILVGVFSENVILSYLTKKEIALIDKDTLIKDFEEFLPIGKHLSEIFKFVSRDELLIDVQEMFQNSLKENKRLAVIYITENGKVDENILGMVTPWDMFKK